jgi:hypothetical protein
LQQDPPRQQGGRARPTGGGSVQDYVGPGALAALLWKAIRLDTETYRRVATESAATRTCLLIVLLAGVAHGLALSQLSGSNQAFLLAVELAVFKWLIVSFVVWLLGKVFRRLDPEPGDRVRKVDFLTVSRPMAIAFAPSCLFVIEAFTGTLKPLELLVAMWVLAATVVAIRAAQQGGLVSATILALIATAVAQVVLFGSAAFEA